MNPDLDALFSELEHEFGEFMKRCAERKQVVIEKKEDIARRTKATRERNRKMRRDTKGLLVHSYLREESE